jgi:hypothetical protein
MKVPLRTLSGRSLDHHHNAGADGLGQSIAMIEIRDLLLRALVRD